MKDARLYRSAVHQPEFLIGDSLFGIPCSPEPPTSEAQCHPGWEGPDKVLGTVRTKWRGANP